MTYMYVSYILHLSLCHGTYVSILILLSVVCLLLR